MQTASFVAGLPAESQRDTVQLIVHGEHRGTGLCVEGGCAHPQDSNLTAGGLCASVHTDVFS